MEDLFEYAIKPIFRVIWYFTYEIFFSTICYFIGWPVCKLLTWGRYPEQGAPIYFEYRDDQSGWPCSLVGLFVIIAFLYLGGKWV